MILLLSTIYCNYSYILYLYVNVDLNTYLYIIITVSHNLVLRLYWLIAIAI